MTVIYIIPVAIMWLVWGVAIVVFALPLWLVIVTAIAAGIVTGFVLFMCAMLGQGPRF